MSLERGDLIWLDFNPQVGREQAGRRPAIVLSLRRFNETTGFAWVCPITRQIKNYAFEIPLPQGLAFEGVVLTDQLKSLDIRRRNIHIIGSAAAELEFMSHVLRNTRSILA